MARNSFFAAPIATGLPVADQDILTAKQLFKELGRLTEPQRGFSTRFDQPLQDTITNFQRERGLTADGVITPGGPTERNIHRDRGVLPAEPPFRLADLDISAPVGNGLPNQPADIIGVSKVLGRLGLMKFDKTQEPSSTISTRLVDGVKKIQEQLGIAITGDLKPGDKAHEALKKTVEAKISSALQKPRSVRESRVAGPNPLRLAQLSSPSSDAVGATNVPDASARGVIRGLKPITEVVEPKDMYKIFQFDPKGPGQFEEALKTPIAVFSVGNLNEEARSRAEKLLETKRFSRREVNAYLHALWSFEVTRKHGADIAKRFGDAHEITDVNTDDERLKDLFNNNVGRLLALDPKNRRRASEEVVLEALRAGKLQVAPVPIPNPPAGVLKRRSRRGSPFRDR